MKKKLSKRTDESNIIREKIQALVISKSNIDITISYLKRQLIDKIRKYPNGATVVVRPRFKRVNIREYGRRMKIKAAFFDHGDRIGYYVFYDKFDKVSMLEDHIKISR